MTCVCLNDKIPIVWFIKLHYNMIVYMIHGGKLVEACLPELKLGGGFMLDKIVEKKVIGIKQCLKFIKLGKGKVLYVANDADARLISPW